MDCVIGLWRQRKFGDKHLVMNDYGDWLFLDSKQFEELRTANLSGRMTVMLKDKNLVFTKEGFEEELAAVVERVRQKKDYLFTGPSLHILIMTLRCDLKCRYCHASSRPLASKGFDMDQETARKTVDMVFKTTSQFITIEFQGGEPLLNFPVMKYVIEYAREKNLKEKKDLRITLVSNLNNMDKEKLDYLMDNEVSICTSLDGPGDLHDLNRGCHARLMKSMELVKKAHEERKTSQRLTALLTVTKESLGRSKDIIDEYIRLGFREIHLRSLNNLGNAKQKLGTISYQAEDFIGFWKRSMDYILSLNKQGMDFKERKSLIILQKVFGITDPNFTDLRSPCGAVTGQLVYNYDGRVFTCDEGRMVEEDLFNIGTVEQEQKEVVTSPAACSIIAASVNDTHFCDSCVYKPLCGICPVLNYAEGGSVIGCIANSDWCKVHMAQFDYIFDKLANDPQAQRIFMSWLDKP